MRLDASKKPVEPIDWPDGSKQPVNNIKWDGQEIMADVYDGKLTTREAMPRLMPMLLPGRTWEEIKAALDLDEMQEVIGRASSKYDEAMKALEEIAGNALAGTGPVSAPPTSAGTSSAESPATMGAPCGAS